MRGRRACKARRTTGRPQVTRAHERCRSFPRSGEDLVEEKGWIGETRFLHALNYCMLLPGPEAHELAIYIGWLMHRVRGGIVAGVLFVLPGLITLSILSVIYALYGQIGIV